MLAVYLDESGTHDDSDVIVVAGLISPVLEWERLTRSWERVLSKNHLREFHTVDCAQGVGAFATWSLERRKRVFRQLVSMIVRYVAFRSWTAIIRPDYEQFFSNERDAKRMAYTICALGCASRIRQLALQQEAPIPYVFEQGGRGGRYARFVLQQLIDQGQTEYYRMSAVTFGSSREYAPLQAADLHAYEVYKYFADQLSASGRSVRRSFRELMHIQEAGGGGYLFTSDKIQRWLEGIRTGERPVQIAVDPLNNKRRVHLSVPPEA